MSVTSPRALAGLLAWLAGGTLLAAVLGAFALVPLQLVYGLGALALAVALHEAPGRGMPLLERLTGPLPALQLEGLCLGASVALVFPALGAFALTASAVNEAWVDEVWRLWFPTLPLLGAFVGLGRGARRVLVAWLARDD